MCVALQDPLQKYKIRLHLRKTPKTTPAETNQNTHQISIMHRRKAQACLVFLEVNEVFSCAFLGFFYEKEESTRLSCAFMCICVGMCSHDVHSKRLVTLGVTDISND